MRRRRTAWSIQGFCLLIVAIVLVRPNVQAHSLRVGIAVQGLQSSRVAQIQDRGKLIVGVSEDFPPLSSRDAKDQLTGFEVALMQEIAYRWLGKENAIEFKEVIPGSRSAIGALMAGEVDLVAAAMTSTQEREAEIDFSQIYLEDHLDLLIQGDSEIQNLQALGQTRIAAIRDSTAMAALEEVKRDQQSLIEIVRLRDYPGVLGALQLGGVTGLISSSAFLDTIVRSNPGNDWHILGLQDLFPVEAYRIGLPKGDDTLKTLVDCTLQAMKSDGTYDQLYKRWLSEQNPTLFAEPYPIAIDTATCTGPFLLPITRPITPTVTVSPTDTPITLPSPTTTPSATRSVTPTATRNIPAAPTSTFTPSITPSATPSRTATPTPTLTPTSTISPTPTPSPTAISVIQKIRNRGYMIAGVKFDFPPFGEAKGNEAPVGFDVDLIQALADQWGIEVRFVQVTSSNRILKLAAGEVDIVAASMTHAKDREELIDFSQTYFLDGQSLLVQKTSGITDVVGLAGKTVGAIDGSTSIGRIQAEADKKKITITVLPFQGYDTALEALKAGAINALTTDSSALFWFAKQNSELTVVGDLFSNEPYGLGLPAGDSYFNNLVNFTLQTLKSEGIYDALYHKWFGEDALPYPVELLPGEWSYTFADSPVELDKTVTSVVDQLRSEGRFKAGVKFDFAPFGFLNKEGELVGFDVDIMKEFAKRWLGDANAVTLLQVTSANRIPKLEAREVDIVAASMTHRQERDERIDFSQTYFFDGQSLLVRADSAIIGLDSLTGRVVAAIEGSSSINNIRLEADKWGFEVLPFQEYPTAIEALKANVVDALTTDSSALHDFARVNPDLKVVDGRFTEEPYGLGVPNYDDRFRDLVNFTLQEMKADGTYDRLYEKWFGNDQPYPIEIWPNESYLPFNLVPMIQVPAGEFIRGNDNGVSNEQPMSTIMLDAFYIDQYEVTNRLYAKCVDAGACVLPKIDRAGIFTTSYFSSLALGNYPVVWVSWEDAQNYCRFVGKRLPTEAEWEKAARGTQAVTYPWGEEAPSSTNNRAKFIGNPPFSTRPVGSYPNGISPYGVHDMAGNVQEWVADWHLADYYALAPAQNPPGPAGEHVTKVVRGGDFTSTAPNLRTTRRVDYLPNTHDSTLGFRCASTNFPPTMEVTAP